MRYNPDHTPQPDHRVQVLGSAATCTTCGSGVGWAPFYCTEEEAKRWAVDHVEAWRAKA